MPKVIQAAEFFVVGGPVQPDRLCYVERPADERCAAVLAAKKHCYVLGPRAIGKSSLMGRVARSLRQAGGLAAIVDLAQIDARGESSEADRWAYSIVHRIAHELRLRVDLSTWWQEKNALAREGRLADFFWEIVLTNTTAPVTVFVDDIEQTIGLPFAQELFAAIADCEARRSIEPDFRRLTFALFGAASLRDLLPSFGRSPPADAESIELRDFTAEESYRLALGLGGEREQAQALMDRVCVWTNGHPYLTQKVARGVARKGGKLEDVERAVREQLLVPRALLEDPPLAHARSVLTAKTPAARQALRLLRRVAKGGKVPAPRDPAVLDALQLSGVAGLDAGGLLRYRNRIFKEALGARWLKTAAPVRWGAWAATALLVVAAALGAGYWYTQYLPLPYIRTLSSTDADPSAVDEAYRRLHGLPGFAERAETLLAEALVRRSGSASTLDAAAATDSQLRSLPNQGERADDLLADFWLRKAELAMQTEQRDAALLYALRGVSDEARASGSAPELLAELIGDDYSALESTTKLGGEPTYWTVDWPRRMLVSIDENRLQRTPLVRGVAPPNAAGPIALTALQYAPVTRELRVDGEGSAGAFELEVAVRHAASGELQLSLSAPSGAQATLVLPRGAADRVEEFVWSGAEGAALASLADEDRSGVWRLALVDRRTGNSGHLEGWGLRFGEESWDDELETAVAIPDPARTEAVTVEPSHGYAVVQPIARSAVGAVALWSLAAGTLQDDFTLPAPPEHAEVNATGTRLLAVAGSSVTIWSVGDGMLVARLATQTEFVLPPVLSADGGYFAIAERVDDAPPLYSLLSTVDGALLASVEGAGDAQSWWLGPSARYVALLGPPNDVRVLDPRRGTELARLKHARDVARLLAAPDGSTLLTIDAAGDIFVWNAAGGSAQRGRLLGTTRDASSASLSADGRRIAYTDAAGDVVVRHVATGAQLHALLTASGASVARADLDRDGALLVTAEDGRFRLWTFDDGDVVPERAGSRVDLAVAALDRDADVIALGLRDGQLSVRSSADLSSGADADLDYFGHVGAINSVAVDAVHSIAATGGKDGSARIWGLAEAEPIGAPLRHPAATAVTAVALSDDGRRLAAAAAESVGVWEVADGTLAAEIPVGAPVTAVAFAPGGERVAIGDAAGKVTFASIAGEAGQATLRGDAAIAALAVAAGGDLLVTGDAAGGVQLWRLAGGAPLGAAQRLPQPPRWLAFDSAGVTLLAGTDRWVHGFTVGPDGLARGRTRFAGMRLLSLAVAGADRARIVGVDGQAVLRANVVDLAGAPRAVAPIDAALLERDWTEALGVALDPEGEIVPLDPPPP